MILLKKLAWDNCFSYGEGNTLDLDEHTVTQIVGTNGTGKSSIPLILEEVLFNKNSKGVKKADIPNRFVNGGYRIALEWEQDGDTYNIEVLRKGGIKVKLYKNGSDISSHTASGTYKTVQDLIGLDYKTFSQLVYQSAQSSLQFLTATDTTRKKFLIDLLHLEEYTKLFDTFKNVAKGVNTEVTSLSSKINTIEKWLADNKLEDTTILPSIKIEIETAADEKLRGKLMSEIDNISEKNQKITKNNQYKKLLKQINLQEINDIEVTQKISEEEYITKIGQCNTILDSARKQAHKLKGLEGICPTCEQPIDQERLVEFIAAEEEIIGKVTEERDHLANVLKDVREKNALFEHKKKAQQEWESLYRSIDQTLPSELVNEQDLRTQLKEVEARLLNNRLAIKEAQEENERRAKRNTRIQVILEQTDKFLEDLKQAEEELTEKNQLLANLEVLKKAFSTNGLLAYKIENLVKELEELANQYLAELSDGRFTLEFVVSNDKLNVCITDEGNVVDILSLSSGELARVNTSTLLAIRKLMSSISKSKINVLFLDEVINVLDNDGREKLVEVLLQEEGLNTYIVSHGYTHPLLTKIEAVKEGNVSALEK